MKFLRIARLWEKLWKLKSIRKTPSRRRTTLFLEELEGRVVPTINIYADSYTVVHDHTLSVSAPGVLANDSDSTGATLSSSLVSNPNYGSVSLNSNGGFTYTPPAHWVGTASWYYKDFNGTMYSNPAMVSITVTDHAPVASNASLNVIQGQSAGISLLSYASDSDGDNLIASIVQNPGHGSVAYNSSTGLWVYTPAANYTGQDSFGWKVNDGVMDSNVATVSITVQAPATPIVTVNDAGGVYNGNAFPAGATATGSGGASVNGTFAFTYYTGSSASGNGSTTAPSNAGTYTVVAAFTSSDPNYTNGQSNPVTFTIGAAMPTVTANDGGGAYNGNSFPASATATGVGANAVNGSFAFTYYSGSTVSGSGSATAPSSAGTYTVVASFTSSNPNYSSAQSNPFTFSISPAAAAVTAVDAGGPFSGSPFQASAAATGVGGAAVSGSFAFTYYNGSTVSGSGSTTAPTNAGTYTVVAAFTSNDANYADRQSNPVTFTISPQAPGLSVSAGGGTFNGNSFAASASATTAQGTIANGTFAYTYYTGGSASGAGSGSAPTVAGVYTVVAAFASSDANYADAQSNPITFTINPAMPHISVTDGSGTYNGASFPASAAARGVDGSSVDGTLALTYYAGSSTSGQGSSTPPTDAGDYTIVATFASNDPNYAGTQSSPLHFTINPAAPTSATTSAADSTYNGSPFPASGSALGLDGSPLNGAFAFTYYPGSDTSGAGSSTAPTNAGTYTVAGTFLSGNPNYANAQTSPVTFTIGLADQDNYPGDVISLPIPFNNPNQTLQFSATSLPDGLSINSATGVITGTVADSAVVTGYFLVTITATQGNSHFSQSFDWFIDPVVQIDFVDDQENFADDVESLPVAATDGHHLTLTFSATGLPPGLTIDSASGLISGTIVPTAGRLAPYPVTVTATDGTYHTDETFDWSVDPVISLDPMQEPADATGDNVSLQISAVDADSNTMTFSANGLPSGLSIDPASGLITGTIDASADTSSPYPVTVTATDGVNTSEVSFSWKVIAQNLGAPSDLNEDSGLPTDVSQVSNSPIAEPDYSAINSPNGTADPAQNVSSDGGYSPPTASFSLTASAENLVATENVSLDKAIGTFTDSNPGSQPGDFSANVDWGDGTSTSANIVDDGLLESGSQTLLGRSYSLAGQHSYGSPGTFTVSVNITGPNGEAATFTDTVQVSQFSAVEAQAFSGNLVSFTPANGTNPQDYSANIAWGDSASSSGTVVAGSNGTFVVQARHTYSQPGYFSPSIQVQAPGGSTSTFSASVLVQDATVTATANSIPAVAGQAFSGIVASFTDGNPLASASSFSVLIGWGDGNILPGTVSANSNGGFDVNGQHTYDQPGSYVLSITITAAGGAATSATGSATVADSFQIQVFSQDKAAVSGPVAWFTDPTNDGLPEDFSASINWGDGSSADDGLIVADGNDGFLVIGDHQYATTGTYTITVTITNVPLSASGSASTDITLDAGSFSSNSSNTSTSGDEETDPVWDSFLTSDGNSGSGNSGQTPPDQGGFGDFGGDPTYEFAWQDPQNPFFAHTLDEAKYRAWAMLPTNQKVSATLVGTDVAATFAVDPTTTWGQFFPSSEYDPFITAREQKARSMDPALLVQLDNDWQLAKQDGADNTSPIGPEVAATWSQITGFEWAVPETGWQELYTQQAYVFLQNERAIAIPTIKADWFRLYGNMPAQAYWNIKYPPETIPVPDQITNELRSNILPRLQYASPQGVKNYVQNLTDPGDRMVLRYAIDLEMARLSNLADAQVATGAAVPAVSNIGATQELYQELYSELHHDWDETCYDADAPTYGLAAPPETTLFDITDQVPNNPNYVPHLAEMNKGSLAQRIAFLADTDYQTFRAREVAFVDVYYGTDWAGIPGLRREAALNSIPSARDYYVHRSLLIHALTTPGFDIQDVFKRKIMVQELVRVPGNSLSSDNPNAPDQVRYTRAWVRVADPSVAVDRYIYLRYIQGRLGGMGDAEYFALDRYNQENMAFPYLAGWKKASEDQKATFANILLPADRGALLDSLARIAFEFRARGDLQTAETARSMAVFIQTCFANDLAVARQMVGQAVIDWWSSFQPVAQGSLGTCGISPQQLAQLPTSIRRMTEVNAFNDFLRWRAANPVNIRYVPATGFVWGSANKTQAEVMRARKATGCDGWLPSALWTTTLPMLLQRGLDPVAFGIGASTPVRDTTWKSAAKARIRISAPTSSRSVLPRRRPASTLSASARSAWYLTSSPAKSKVTGRPRASLCSRVLGTRLFFSRS